MTLSALLKVEIVRYGMISALAFAVDLCLLTLLTHIFGIHYLLAATFSFIVGGVVAYFLCIRFVFRYHRIPRRTFEGAAFVALGLVGLVVNGIIMALVVGRAGASIVVGKMAAACATFGVNYLLRRFALFTPHRRAADNSAATRPE